MKHLMKERGFALVTVLFALVLMSAVAVASLVLADDERRASRAMRAGNASFYAAEAGLNEVWATRFGQAFADSLQKGLIVLPPGESVDLGWKTLSNGARYNGRLWRYDNGGQRIYGLVSEGRGARGLSGQQRAAFGMTTRYGSGGTKLGKCCAAAGTVRGDVLVEGTSRVAVTGMDGTPTSGWPASRCTDIPPVNKPGVVTKDPPVAPKVTVTSPAKLEGNPARMQDASMNDATFLQYGDITFADLKAMANHTFDGVDIPSIGPTTKVVDGVTVCDTANRFNWGSNTPGHVCYDYFPIILLKGAVHINGGAYGQGLILMDRNPTLGAELDFEQTGTFAGLIVGFGCIEIQSNAKVYGAVFGDDEYYLPDCGDDVSLRVKESGTLQWSSCVVERVLQRTGVGEASGGVQVAGMRKLSRGFWPVLW
jgi:hypothetical protein